LLREVRRRLGSAAWDVLVAGRAEGRLVAVESLKKFERSSGQAIVLLSAAAGDEEIPNNVSGIVLGHDMPHLSHLSVRARQAGVVFVACEEALELEPLRKLQDQTLLLEALPDSVTWKTVDKTDEQSVRKQRAPL